MVFLICKKQILVGFFWKPLHTRTVVLSCTRNWTLLSQSQVYKEKWWRVQIKGHADLVGVSDNLFRNQSGLWLRDLKFQFFRLLRSKLEIKDSNVGACLNGVSQWLAWCMIVRSGEPRAQDFVQIKLQTKLHKKIVHEPLFGLLSPTHLWVCSCLQHRRSAVQFNISLILAGYLASHLRCLNRVLFLSLYRTVRLHLQHRPKYQSMLWTPIIWKSPQNLKALWYTHNRNQAKI